MGIKKEEILTYDQSLGVAKYRAKKKKQQIFKSPRIKKSKKSKRVGVLKTNPQLKGVCLKFSIIAPKKPNSAKRKVVRV